MKKDITREYTVDVWELNKQRSGFPLQLLRIPKGAWVYTGEKHLHWLQMTPQEGKVFGISEEDCAKFYWPVSAPVPGEE